MALYDLRRTQKGGKCMEQNTFEVRYNITGDERKRLVRAMGDILEAEPKYLGAPSFAYEIDYFTVEKTASLSLITVVIAWKSKTS